MPAVYVSRDEFRRRTGSQGTGTDAVLDAQLETACRSLDRELGVAPGMFAPLASTAFKFTPTGGTTLWLRDTAGYQYFLRTITSNSLAIDYDQDGAYDDYAWDLADAWVRGIPENAASFDEPFTAIELDPYATSAPLSAWPTYKNSVQITGTWGFETTPGAVSELVVDIVKNLRMGALSGGAGTAVFAEDLVSPSMFPVLQRLKAQYSHRLPI